ncbi:unnamed protein product [Effrenium voratum]|nr:unnamed protein product [Effrenium voratum]
MADPDVVGKPDADSEIEREAIPLPQVLAGEASDCRRFCCCAQLSTTDSRSSTCISIFSFLLVLVAWSSAILSVYVSRNSFPQPQPARAGGFSEERAWLILEAIQQIGAHPVIFKSDLTSSGYSAPPANVALFNVFKQEIQGIQLAASDRVTVELQVPTTGRISSGSSYYDFISARLRVNAASSSYSKAMLLTAHFDSVVPDGVRASEDALGEMGEGLADDGVGCAAVLETFRALATASEVPLVDVILLLTNGEEAGYLGLDSFMASSPWAADVGFFLQMDQSGSRGHALAVFGDAGSGEMAAAFAYHSGAVRPHTSVLLRDFQPWENLNTDGSRLRATYGVPGIGMYMMEDRCPYHSVHDDLSHITRGNLQAHGDNFVGVSRAVTRDEAILGMWAGPDSDPTGDAYTIDLLSSSMLLLTPATMGILYGVIGIATMVLVLLMAYLEPRGGSTAVVDVSLLAVAHVASVLLALVVSFVIAGCVGTNFGYWYQRDGLAVWLYMLPSLCVQLLFGRVLHLKRFSQGGAEFAQWRSSTAMLVLLLLLTVLLAIAGLHLSLLFGMCALTRLAGFVLRIAISFIAQRLNKKATIEVHDAQVWLGIISELALASLGSVYLLDAMRFAVVNFTTSLGKEGAILPGDLTLAVYVGLFGSLAIMQSSAVQVLSTKCVFAGHLLLTMLVVSICLVVTAFALPVYSKYPCEVPGFL